MKNSWLFSPNGQAMTLSIGLHLFVLGLAYCMQRTPAPGSFDRQAYSIALQSTSSYKIANHYPVQNTSHAPIQAVDTPVSQTNKLPNNQLKNRYFRPKQQRQKQPNGVKVAQKVVPPHQAPAIDARGLYNTGKNAAAQTSATLELRGWEWDVVPNPKDMTEECGKIVFEIKVDQDGEIISIHTLEKTVTPMVEKIYADALRALTFSKTAETPSGISVGKVTFVLVAK